jgi:DNA-binding LacI/PurR family transcriptional regulator
MERSRSAPRYAPHRAAGVAKIAPQVATTRPRRPGASPTIFDVAALAGVSKSTVSNVIRGTDGVAASTRDRVERAIEILGYRPNVLARQFVQQRTTILGVLVGDLDNPFYAEMAKRVERYAFDAGYTAMFCNIEGEEDFALSRVESLLEQRVAGVLFLAFFGRSPDVQRRLDATAPVVFAGLREDWGDSVSVNDSGGAKLATGHLIELGHRRIAYLTTDHVEPRASRARLGGYRSVMRAAGAAPGPVITWAADSEDATVKNQRVRLLDQLTGRNGVTAVFCSNDLGAIGLLEFADRHGIDVPGELSIVGFDNVQLAGLARISLTTVSQPFDDIARMGVEAVLGRLSGSITGAFRHEVVRPELVVRTSTGPPRARAGASP